MEQTIKKFVHLLEEYMEQAVFAESRKIILNNPSSLINPSILFGIATLKLNDPRISKEDIEKAKELDKKYYEFQFIISKLTKEKSIDFFTDFEMLSTYLIETKMNAKECLDIIIYLINSSLSDIEKFKEKYSELDISYSLFSFKKINQLSIEDRCKLEEYSEYITLSPIVLSKTEKRKKEYFNKIITLIMIDNPKKYFENLNLIKEKYIDKEILEENDMADIINALNILGVDKKITSKIGVLLTKEINSRNKLLLKSETLIKEDNIVKKEDNKKSNIITNKEYKAIKKELMSYFDFCNNKVIRELNKDEIIHCIELLIKIDTPVNKINDFIKQFEVSEQDNKTKCLSLLDGKNVIALYVEVYNKLKFYEIKLNITEELKYIEECLKEMFICTDEDYEFYKNEIELSLRQILIKLPQTYEYEIKEIEKRIKLKKDF